MIAETTVALREWIWPSFFLRSMIMGNDPTISIMEKRMSVTERISFQLIDMLREFRNAKED